MVNKKVLEIESQIISINLEHYLLIMLLKIAKEAGYTHVRDHWGVNAADEYSIDDAMLKFKGY